MSHWLCLLGHVRKDGSHRRRVATAARLSMALLLALSLLVGAATPMQAATTITFTAEELLGKPTDTSITINIVPASTIEYHYQYGTVPGVYTGQTENAIATGGQPHEIVISGLSPNTRYYYRMRYHVPGEQDWVQRPERSFWTQRAKGTTFQFTVTSDIHNNIGTNYSTAMTSINEDQPDFHIDLGDTFMVDSSANQTAINNAYLTHRGTQYLGRIGSSIPIFLSSGNHENEEGWNLDDTPFSVGVGNIQARKAFFPTPIDEGPGGFYSGNTDPLPRIDKETYGDELREDYYAWTWGDALFVVIDPFQYTMELPYAPAAGEGSDDAVTGNQWSWTLGEQQYKWLKETLENSDAKYKFMFSHNMLGGIPRNIVGVGAGYVRGGAEAAAYFEWGGRNYDGSEGFADHRDPEDFPYTIHQLMVDNGVSAYFHGHDHQYVYERRDGIVYQEVPSPTMTGTGFGGIYTVGTYPEYETIAMCPGAGYLQITVAPDAATVEYVRTAGTGTCTPSTFPRSYTIEPNATGPTRVLTTAVAPAEGGTISPPAGTYTYPEGATVEVTATPNPGYTFDHWSGDCTGAGRCSVTLDADKSVTANFAAITGNVRSAATPSAGTLAVGNSVLVAINVDMSEVEEPNNALGSFAASLTWNPAVLAYEGHSGPLAGFTGAVNTASVASGQIFFNGSNATGATGDTVTFEVTFRAIGAGTSELDLEYSTMAAASSSADLLPLLTITDGQVMVDSSWLGDIDGNGTVNSTDALLILSADAGIDTSGFCPMNCGDVNGDGLVNSSDALLVLSYDAGMSVPFPVGTGACPASITQPPGCGF